MAWVYAVVFIAALLIGYFITPKPETRPPAGLDEIIAPTAEVGREIPVLFGTKRLSGPNVVWYGDFRTTPVKSKGGK